MANSPIIFGSTGAKYISQPQGAANSVLTNDGAGNLSWNAPSTPTATTFTINDNQTSFANVTGFLVDPTLFKAFTAETATVRQSANSITDAEDTDFYTNLGTAAASNVNAVAQLSDGSIILGGDFTSFNGLTRNFIVKTDSSGIEDTTFYTNLGTAFDNSVYSIGQQSTGIIFIGGDFTNTNSNGIMGIEALNLNGTEATAIAANFGTGFGSGATIDTIAVQTDDKVLIGGAFTSYNGNTRNYLIRLNADGTEDTAFYTNLGTGFNLDVRVIKVQADGKIIVGGAFTTLNGNTRDYLVRLNSDGTEDTAFYTSLGTSFNQAVLTVAYQPDTKILVGGGFTSFNGNTRNSLVRLTSTGSEDTAFYTNLGTGFNDNVASVGLQSTGNIVVVGYFTSLNGNTRNRLLRLSSAGVDDTAFYTTLGTALNATVTFTNCLFVQSDDQLLIGGSFTAFNSLNRDRVFRYEMTTVNDYRSQDTIKGVYHPSTSSWTITNPAVVGDATGLTLQMTNTGQLQYKTTNIGTTIVTSTFSFYPFEGF